MADHDDDLVRVYLDEIGAHPLLTRPDEARLAAANAAGNTAADELARGVTDPTRRRQLRAQVRAGDEAATTFVESNPRLVVSIAKRYQSSGVPFAGLIQESNLGPMHAVGKLDHTKGFKFSTYATWWIRQAITRSIANTGRTIRRPVHIEDQLRQVVRTAAHLETVLHRPPTTAELADEPGLPERRVAQLLRFDTTPVSLSTVVDDHGDTELVACVADEHPDPADLVADESLADDLARVPTRLEEREQRILTMRFGLGTVDGPCTLHEVGAAFGITRERARQIEADALAKLRRHATEALSDHLVA